MREKQKGENCPSSKKRGFDQGALVGGGKGGDLDIKYRNKRDKYIRRPIF